MILHLYPALTVIRCWSAANDDLKEMKYAKEANRALGDPSTGCLFGTRTEVNHAAQEWGLGMPPSDDRRDFLNILDPEMRAFWICGVAGAGKSSIAISLAKAFRQMGVLGSLYSFQVAQQATLNPTNLFSTIARHLAQYDPSRKQRLVEIIRENDSIIPEATSPTKQFEDLLLALLTRDKQQIATKPTVIVIDAFDECGDFEARRETLNILTHRIHELPADVRFIITSRYEEDVQRALGSLPKDTCLLKMEDIPEDSTKHDIHAYVHHELQDVRGLESDDYVSKLSELAIAAEKSFQWASTACRFIRIGNDDARKTKKTKITNPQLRLQEILQTKAGLDPLYRLILNQHYEDLDDEALRPLHAILGCLVYAQEPLPLRAIIDLAADSPNARDPDTKFDVDDFYHGIAQTLSSLVTGTQDLKTPLIALHTSFTDFLSDETRGGQYFIKAEPFRERLSIGCLKCMRKRLKFNIGKLATSFKRNDDVENIEALIQENISIALSYACRFWPYHLSKVSGWTESEGLGASVVALLGDRVLEWLEVISLTGSSALDLLGPIAGTKVMRIYLMCFHRS